MELTASVLPDFAQSKPFKTYFKASGFSEVETLLEILSVRENKLKKQKKLKNQLFRILENQLFFKDI